MQTTGHLGSLKITRGHEGETGRKIILTDASGFSLLSPLLVHVVDIVHKSALGLHRGSPAHAPNPRASFCGHWCRAIRKRKCDRPRSEPCAHSEAHNQPHDPPGNSRCHRRPRYGRQQNKRSRRGRPVGLRNHGRENQRTGLTRESPTSLSQNPTLFVSFF